VADKVQEFAELYNRGMELIESGQDKAGLDTLFDAAKTAPEGWLALCNLLIKEKAYGPAEDRCKEILSLTKDSRLRAAALNNLGMIYCAIYQTDLAEEMFRMAIREFPQAPDAHSNMGLVCQWAQRFDEAIRHTSRALSIDPWHEQAQFIRATVNLLRGDYHEGFLEYECRWRSKNNGLSKLNCNMPEWDGHNGKRLFVYGEQGHGDSILMLRYAREIRKLGIHQIWVCQNSLTELVQTIPEIDQVVKVGDPLPDFDCHLPAVSLPRVFKTSLETIPAAPYLTCGKPLDYGEGFHVGVCWRGNQDQTNDGLRSTNLKQWDAVFAVPGVTFHSLQVDNAAEGELYPALRKYEKPAHWGETVARVAGLDLVISVDTAIVHLAGALGKQCWCALHSRPYFVYPPKLGPVCPWYDSVRLFRSERPGDWPEIFQQIANELKENYDS
jgi:tetratricopeptide (TPR) repeat protein